jgi:uncharacterized OB-fold protein
MHMMGFAEKEIYMGWFDGDARNATDCRRCKKCGCILLNHETKCIRCGAEGKKWIPIFDLEKQFDTPEKP